MDSEVILHHGLHIWILCNYRYLCSEYGYRNDLWEEKVGKIIRVNKEPQWELKDFYFPPFEGSSVVEKHYSFK
jgi:hypothetical protein